MSLKSWGDIARNQTHPPHSRRYRDPGVRAIRDLHLCRAAAYQLCRGPVGHGGGVLCGFRRRRPVGNSSPPGRRADLAPLQTNRLLRGRPLLGTILWASALVGRGACSSRRFVSVSALRRSTPCSRLVWSPRRRLASGTVALNTSCIYIGQAVGSGIGGFLFDRGYIGTLNGAAIIFVVLAIAVLTTTRGPGETLPSFTSKR